MKLEFPAFESDRYRAIIMKDIQWLDQTLDSDYIHIHSNGEVEDKSNYLKGIGSDQISFRLMTPINWKIRKKLDLTILTGISRFQLVYFKKDLDLKLAYHSIWNLNDVPKYVSWQATKING